MDTGKHRTSRRRQIILELVRSMHSHPTANELYEQVRKQLPNISLGTIYRNLDLLCEQGQVQRLRLGGGQTRYDGWLEEHCHVQCVSCGRVDDVDLRPLAGDLGVEAGGYEVLACHVALEGLCAACRARAHGATDALVAGGKK